MEKKYHTTGTFPKSKRGIVERGKIDTHNIQIHVNPVVFSVSPIDVTDRQDVNVKVET
jgi:hypothetical protein